MSIRTKAFGAPAAPSDHTAVLLAHSIPWENYTFSRAGSAPQESTSDCSYMEHLRRAAAPKKWYQQERAPLSWRLPKFWGATRPHAAASECCSWLGGGYAFHCTRSQILLPRHLPGEG